jgi:hypothetical protein
VEWIGSGADRAAGRCGAAHTRCTKPGRSAGEQRGHVDDARHADACESAEYLAAAIDPDAIAGEYVATAVNSDAGSCKHVSATINADAVFELDAAADGFSEPAELCDQCT